MLDIIILTSIMNICLMTDIGIIILGYSTLIFNTGCLLYIYIRDTNRSSGDGRVFRSNDEIGQGQGRGGSKSQFLVRCFWWMTLKLRFEMKPFKSNELTFTTTVWHPIKSLESDLEKLGHHSSKVYLINLGDLNCRPFFWQADVLQQI